MTDTISNPGADAGPPEGLIGSITLESVGAAAGVSRSTVSRVVNGSPNVSQKTIDAVMKAIADLGYVHNRVAATLASKQASVVTALIPEDLDLFFKDPYFHAMISGIQDHFASTNLVLNLMIASRDSFPKVLSSLAGGQSDGVLVFSHHTEHQLVDALERRMPVVFGGRPVLEDEAHSYVDVELCRVKDGNRVLDWPGLQAHSGHHRPTGHAVRCGPRGGLSPGRSGSRGRGSGCRKRLHCGGRSKGRT